MSAVDRLNRMREIAESFTFDTLEFVDALPEETEGVQIIYNGFPPDDVQRMDIPEIEKMRNTNIIIQRIVLGILNTMSSLGIPLDTPDMKAVKTIDEHTGREILVLFVMVNK